MRLDGTHLKRKLTAILLADVVGYSRLMCLDEEGTHARLSICLNSLVEPQVSEYGGRLIGTRGDGVLAEFDSASDAVRCGLAIQREMALRSPDDSGDRRLQLRIGINIGDVIVDNRDIYGNSINIAARLESLARPGEVYVTRAVRDQLMGCPDLGFVDMGDHSVKNIDHPIRIFRVEQSPKQDRLSVPGLVSGGAKRLFRRGALLVAVVLALAGLAATTLPRLWDPQVLPARQASIIVLPFRSTSDNPEEAYFADAVTDDLTTDLSRLSNTLVIARATAFAYRGKSIDPRQIAKECGVRYILEGDIRKIGAKIQATARLVDAQNAVHVWADRFGSEVTNLSELHEAVTGRIATSLGVQLIRAESRRSMSKLGGPDAIDLRLRAMAILSGAMTPENSLRAREFLEKAINANPLSAQAFSDLANVLISDYLNRWNEAPGDLLTRAEQALDRADALDPNIATSWEARGFIRRARGDHPGALEAFRRAVELNPNLPVSYAQQANALALTGRPEEAPALVEKALRLSPLDESEGIFKWIRGRAHFMMREYKSAIEWLRQSVSSRPNLWFNRAYLISALALDGRLDEAQEELKRLNTVLPGFDQQRIREIYAKELPNNNPVFQRSITELFDGLTRAGMT